MNPEISLTHIESSARKLRAERDRVAALVRELNDKISALQSEYSRRLKGAINVTSARHSELASLIDANRDLFIKPRTVTFHGINCGIEKQKGRIDFDSADAVIAAAAKKFPDQLDILAPSKRKLSLTALKNLTVAELKMLGCTVEETGDRVIVRFTDKEVDKLVSALLRDATEETQPAEAA